MGTASAIYILWLRQVKRYMRSKARLIGSFGQPLLFLLALGFGFGPIYQKAGGGNYMQFLAPGIIAMAILFTSVFSGIEFIWDRQFGFLKETLVAPVSRSSIIIGRILGGATVATLQGVVVFIITLFVGFTPKNIAMLPLALIFMFLVAIMFTAFGTAVASRMEDMQAFPIISNFLVMPMFFLSGSLFPLSGLPSIIEIIAKIDPLSYGVDAFHGTLNNLTQFGLFTDFAVLAVLTIILIAICTFLFDTMEV